MSVKKSNLRKIISEYPVPIDYKKLVLQKNKLIIDQAKKIHKLKNNMRRMRKLRYNSCLDLKKKCLNKVESVINNNKGITNTEIARILNWTFHRKYFTWELATELAETGRVQKIGYKYYSILQK